MEVVKSCSNYIGGEWMPPQYGGTTSSVNPANREEIVGQIPLSTKEDLDRAVAAAKGAQGAWRKLAGSQRGAFLFKAADVLERRLDEIGRIMTLEMGKTLTEAKGETARGVAILRYYAGEGMRKIGDVIPATDSDAFMFTTRVPLGVVGAITPWNFPVAIPIWKLAPALIYGNAVVWKPASETAVTAALVMECFHEAGLPSGVLNLVIGSGREIGQGLAEHPDVQGITFTGSNGTGKAVGQAAFARGAKYQLEMGGKNPIIVAADADMDLAIDATISGGFKSSGQKCTATSRVIVVKDIYDSFRDKLVEKAATLRVGNGLSESTWLGPCANEKQYETVLDYIRTGVEEGATLALGGTKPEEEELRNGYYVTPAIFENVASRMAIAQEEIFGPVLALIKANDLADAIELANDVPYGLSASLYTKDIASALAFIQDMDAGLIRINAETAGVELQAPFGGMKASSSHTREQGQAAIEFYTSIKTVFMKP
jgi:acyl-CoA reductase-like NAD-dependent aldehyde dehydrogenase